jgi:predicted GTPase
LANVLVNKEKKFKEHDSLMSVTKNIQVEEFEHQGTKYRIVDTIGIDDNTGLTNEEIIQRIAETTYKMRNGVTQILFVTKDRFSKSEIDVYNLL